MSSQNAPRKMVVTDERWADPSSEEGREVVVHLSGRKLKGGALAYGWRSCPRLLASALGHKKLMCQIRHRCGGNSGYIG